MAASLPTQAQQALTWQAYGADASNLVCPIQCDFTTYSAYTFNPQGVFRQRGVTFATGLVVDNLLNSTPIIVTIGPITETIPGYTKTTLQLGGTSAQVTVTGQQSRLIVTFYFGTYLGTTGGTNYYAAQIAAGLAVETGFISMFAGSTAAVPVGYLVCDGTPISRTTYAGLFSVIGTLYGQGDGSTTFNLPDLTSRVPIGAGTGAGLTTRALGSKGGAEQVTLSATQMPVHTHAVSDPGHAHGVSDPGHAHGVNDTGHAHGVNDNGHTHTFNDPGHNHGVNDPGHGQLFSFQRSDTGAQVATPNRILWDAGGAPNTWQQSLSGVWVNAGRPNFWDVAESYYMYINASSTGISNQAASTGGSIASSIANLSIQGNLTGVSIKSVTTGVGIQTGTTGITLGQAGGNAGATQPFATVPPYTGVNFVIKT